MVFLEKRRILKTLTQGFFDDFHSILGHGRRENEWRAGQTEIAEHRHYLAFPLGLGEAVNFRQIGKLRVFIFSWHSEDDMEIDETLFQPFALPSHQPLACNGDATISPRIKATLRSGFEKPVTSLISLSPRSQAMIRPTL